MTAILLTRDDVLALRAQAEAGHWDNVAGVRLLREVERVIRPVLRATARRYRVPVEELTSTTMRAGWQALRRYDPAKSPDPWGWVAATARRAAGDAAVMASTGQPARGRARLAAAVDASRRRLAGELGREPCDGEVVAALRPELRAAATGIAADGDLAAFTGVAAPLLTYDEATLDRPVPSPRRAASTRCAWRTRLAEQIGVELGLPIHGVEGVLELAADLAGDLIPAYGAEVAVPRIVEELTCARLDVLLTHEYARRVVEALLLAAHAASRPNAIAA